MVLRSFPLMVHAWENGAKQALARKCRDCRRGVDDDEDNAAAARRGQEVDDGFDDDDDDDIGRLAREFIDDEAIVVSDEDDELPDLTQFQLKIISTFFLNIILLDFYLNKPLLKEIKKYILY